MWLVAVVQRASAARIAARQAILADNDYELAGEWGRELILCDRGWGLGEGERQKEGLVGSWCERVGGGGQGVG